LPFPFICLLHSAPHAMEVLPDRARTRLAWWQSYADTHQAIQRGQGEESRRAEPAGERRSKIVQKKEGARRGIIRNGDLWSGPRRWSLIDEVQHPPHPLEDPHAHATDLLRAG
jgi:hypothetical protein